MRKILINLLLILLVFAAGLFLAQYISFTPSKTIEQNESIIVLERIKKVAKLVTIEGYFSESYSHKEWTKNFGMDFNFGPFKKEAKLRVSAKVLVGFDLEKMIFETNATEKKFYISELPEPEVLSIEPEIVYEDLYEGYFNAYSKEERTRLNKMAMDYIRDVASKNEKIKENAVMQGYEILKIIETLAKDAGWEVEYVNDNKIPKLIIDSLKIKE